MKTEGCWITKAGNKATYFDQLWSHLSCARQNVTILNCPHLSTCTNEPSGEDLCARWMVETWNDWERVDLGACDADWVSLSGELHLAVYIVVLARHSVCNVLSETDFESPALLQLCGCTLCLFVTSGLILVDCSGSRQRCCGILYTAANYARISDIGGCSTRLQICISTTSHKTCKASNSNV